MMVRVIMMATAAAQARKKAVCRRGVGARGCGPSVDLVAAANVAATASAVAARVWVLRHGDSRKPDLHRGRGGGQGGHGGRPAHGQQGRVLRPREWAVGGIVALARDENGTAPEAACRNCVRRIGDQGTINEAPCRGGVRPPSGG
jgi:hypothetical protein